MNRGEFRDGHFIGSLGKRRLAKTLGPAGKAPGVIAKQTVEASKRIMDTNGIRGTWLTQATENGIQDKGGHGIRPDTETGRDTDGARRIRTRDVGTGSGATGLNGLTAQLSATSYPD